MSRVTESKGRGHSQARAVGKEITGGSFRFTLSSFQPVLPRVRPNKSQKTRGDTVVFYSVLGTGWDLDAWRMGAGVGDKIRITDQKGVLCTTHVHPWEAGSGTGTVDYISTFCTNFLSGLPWNYALALVVILLKETENFPENMFPN